MTNVNEQNGMLTKNCTPLNALPEAKVFERMHIELVGPSPKTSAGHEHILVCVDSFSRLVEAFPLHDQSVSIIYS